MDERIGNSNGFTLLELMVVILIIGMLSGIFGMVIVRRLPDYYFNNYVLNLKGAMEKARLAAVRNDADVFVVLNATNNGYGVFIDNTTPTNAANLGVYDAGDTVVEASTAPDGAVFTELFNTTTNSVVTFSSRGFSDISGNICLKSRSDKYKGVNLTLAGCTSIIRSSDGSTWN